jgi:Root hair defective 3 GTP-binding protein (RHD3)
LFAALIVLGIWTGCTQTVLLLVMDVEGMDGRKHEALDLEGSATLFLLATSRLVLILTGSRQ